MQVKVLLFRGKGQLKFSGLKTVPPEVEIIRKCGLNIIKRPGHQVVFAVITKGV